MAKVSWNGRWYDITTSSGASWSFEPEEVENRRDILDGIEVWTFLRAYHDAGRWAHLEDASVD